MDLQTSWPTIITLSVRHRVGSSLLAYHELTLCRELRQLLSLLSNRLVCQEDGQFCLFHLLHLQRCVVVLTSLGLADLSWQHRLISWSGWKRLLLADGPRQSINGIILFSFGKAMGFETNNIPAYWNNDALTAMLLFSMIATVLIFAGSLILLIAAAVLYVPFLCYIQGNLKVSHPSPRLLSGMKSPWVGST